MYNFVPNTDTSPGVLGTLIVNYLVCMVHFKCLVYTSTFVHSEFTSLQVYNGHFYFNSVYSIPNVKSQETLLIPNYKAINPLSIILVQIQLSVSINHNYNAAPIL